MKFLLIYPPFGKIETALKRIIRVGAQLPPLGLLYLSSMLETNGHDVEIFDYNAEVFQEDILKEKVLSSDAVGMTIYGGESYKNSIMLSNFIKGCDPDIPLLIGGPQCSMHAEGAFLDHHADICVMGEGELVINPLAEAIEGKRKFSTIPGIFYKEHNSRMKRTRLPERIVDLDILPFPARHLVDKYKYGFWLEEKTMKGKVFSIVTSRGCPFHCRFCGMHKILPGHQKRSIDNITKEIEEIMNAGCDTLVFVDDNFLFHRKQVKQIMDFIIKHEMDIRIWIENARVDSADRGLFQKLKDAGTEAIHFGIESGNQDVLDYYDKRTTIMQIQNAINLSKKMDFFVSGSFILGAPIETEEHINNTIKFAKSLPLDIADFYILTYSVGTPLWEEAVKEGKISQDEHLIKADSRRGLGNFTYEELENFKIKADKSFFYNPKLWLRESIYAFTKMDFRFLKMGSKMIFR
jgi:radical SAM superfamily enzyme YgiQ (UPF0313 family)